MTDYTTRIISIDDATSGMIVSKDVFTDVGFTLITKYTVLNDKNIVKLKLYQIPTISIKEPLTNVPSSTKSIPKFISTNKKEAFKTFTASYDHKIDSLQNHMLDIGEGKNINISELYSISNDLKNTLNSKSDLFNFLSNLQSTDDCTYTHCVNVSLLCHTIGSWLELNDEELQDLSVAGLLHDIGKTKIDSNLLKKTGKLTDEEFEEIKKHSLYGFRLVEHQNIPYNIKMAVLMHHERYDGSGYPLHVKNDQINKYAKIVAIADVYDSMTSNRCYRNKLSPFQVIHHLSETGYNQFDTKILMTFLKNIASCYVGNWCRLSTGEEAKITFINKNMLSKPMVQIDHVILDLREEKDVFIEEIL